MEKYPYLAQEGKAKTTSLVLIVLSTLLALYALFGNSLTNVATWLSAILAAILFGFAMHYLEYHNVQGQSIKKYVLAYHCFAVHAILVALTTLTGAHNTFSNIFVWALADAALMAGLLTLAKVFKAPVNNAVIVVLSIIAFVLTLLGADVIANILFVIVGVVLVVFAINDSIPGILLGAVVAVLSLIALFNKQTPAMHHYIHYLTIILSMLVAYFLYKVVDPDKNDELAGLSRSSLGADTRSSVARDASSRSNLDTAAKASVATGAAATAGKKASSKKSDKDSDKSYTRSSKIFADYDFDRSWFIADYKDLPYVDLLNAPVWAFKGVSEEMAEDLRAAFGIKTIGELADSKYFAWAKEIVEEANK